MKNIVTMVLFTIISILMSSCATIPEGDLQLGPRSLMTEERQKAMESNLKKGRPIFLESYMYPRLLSSGDVFDGGKVFVNIGNENLSLDDLIDQSQGDPQGGPQPTEKETK